MTKPISNNELDVMVKNIDRRVQSIEEAIKILTDLRVNEVEIRTKLENIENKLRARDKVFLALISPLVAGVVTLILYILAGRI